MTWFNKQSRLVQIILLLIPFVNWAVEIIVRWSTYMKKGGTVVVNTQRILPMPVITGARKYPEDILDELNARAGKVVAVDALAVAEELGELRSVNVVMLGALAAHLGVPFESMDAALKAAVKPKLYEINRRALERGYGQREE